MAGGALCDVYMNLHICMLQDCLQNVIAVVCVKLGVSRLLPEEYPPHREITSSQEEAL